MLDAENYITIFDKGKVSIFDANDTKITVSKKVILEGWHVKKEGLWRILLGKNVRNINADIVSMKNIHPSY